MNRTLKTVYEENISDMYERALGKNNKADVVVTVFDRNGVMILNDYSKLTNKNPFGLLYVDELEHMKWCKECALLRCKVTLVNDLGEIMKFLEDYYEV